MKKVFYILICVCMMFLPMAAHAASISKDVKEGNKLYNKKKYSDAINSYKKALEIEPDSDSANFNHGTALYKQGKYQEALDAFTKALNTEDRKIEAAAVYNMANSKYKMGAEQVKTDPNNAVESYKQSLDYYKRAVELDQGNNDAKYNHELVEKELRILIDRLKNQPPPEKNEDKDKDKDKDKKENKEGEKQQQQGEKNKEEQSGEKGKEEQKAGQEEDAGEDGKPQDNRKMTPEEANMLLDTVGEEGSMEDLKKQSGGHYRGVLKDW